MVSEELGGSPSFKEYFLRGLIFQQYGKGEGEGGLQTGFVPITVKSWNMSVCGGMY